MTRLRWPRHKEAVSVSIGGETQSVSLSTQGSVLKGVSINFARNS